MYKVTWELTTSRHTYLIIFSVISFFSLSLHRPYKVAFGLISVCITRILTG